MLKRLQSVVAMALLTTVAVFAASNVKSLDLSALQIPVGVKEAPSIEAALQAQVNGEAEKAGAMETLVAKYARNEAVELPQFVDASQPLTLTETTVSRLATPEEVAAAPKQKARVARAAKVKTGSIVAKDLAYSSSGSFSTIGYKATLETVDATDESKGYILDNIYNSGYSVNVSINSETGAVSVPYQKIFDSSTYGEVSFVKIIFTETGFTYSKDPVEGTIDENGRISLGSWAMMITEMNEDGTAGTYFGRCYIVAKSTDWVPANAHAKALDMTDGTDVAYDFLIEQSGEQGVKLYAFFNPGTVVITGRITSSKTLSLSSQTMYVNAYYGNFNNYPATYTYNESTSKWTVKADTKNPITVFTTTADKTLYTEGWLIGATASPTSYMAYAYKDFYITLDEDLTWPTQAVINFDGQGTLESPYLLKTTADFTKLSQLVAEGNSFKGIYFKVANDVDFSSVSEFYAIGDSNIQFEGVFDGDNHTLSNLSFNGAGYLGTGLFGYLGESAAVKNINISRFVLQTQGSYLGGIAGVNYGTIENCHLVTTVLYSTGDECGGIAGLNYGTISECSFQGSATGAGSVGGIVGQAMGTIDKCYVKANLTGTSYETLSHDVGGIAGVLQKATLTNSWATGTLTDSYGRDAVGGLCGRTINSTIKECFTTVAISAKRSYADSSGGGDNYTGGLLASASGVVMEDCYSSATIIKTGSYSSNYVGGIVGYLSVSYVSSTAYEGTRIQDVSTIKNCYFSGMIYSSASDEKKGIFGSTFTTSGYTGESPDALAFTNCHYDNQMTLTAEDYYGRNTSYFTNGLPEGYDSNVWVAKQGYYPTLKNTGADAQAQELASAPIILRDGQSASKVKIDFTLTPSTNVTWGILESSTLKTETDALKYSGNTVTVKDIYSNSTIAGQTADGWSIKMYYLSIVPKLFEGEGTAEDPYQVKTVADLEILNDAVSNHAQGHVGDYFAQMNDIDCTATETLAFKGVGSGSGSAFGGTYDGKNYSIKNWVIDAVGYDDDGKAVSSTSTTYVGLFGIVQPTGTVKNVTIDKSCKFTFYSMSAPVVGLNYGIVDGCRNYADVAVVSAYAAGIVSYNYGGTIQNCYNSGRINVGGSQAGGITSYNSTGSLISQCQNDGDVYGATNNSANASTSRLNVGGITGYNYGTVELCVNNGAIEGNNSVGGIIARNSVGVVYGCVNNGIVTTVDNTSYRGGIIGYLLNAGKYSYNYYDSSVNVNGAVNGAGAEGITGLSTSEMVAGVCPTELKSLGAEEIFDFTANAYPVLKQFANEEAAKTVRKIYVAFQPKVMRTNIGGDVELSPETSVNWSLKQNTSFKIDGSKLLVTVPTGMEVAADTLTAVSGDYSKVFNLASLPEILEGSGTQESPYLIKTAADWNKLANFIESTGWEYNGNYFSMPNDIDFQGDSIRVVGVNGASFQGIFDGGNHTIKGYVYQNTNSVTTATKLKGPNFYQGRYIGIFGTLGSVGEIKNLIIDGDFEGYSDIAGLCGHVYGKISNVIHRGTVHNSTGAGCSGLAYRVYTGGSMIDCVNEGTVTAKTTTAVGIVKETQVGTVLQRCINRGNVAATTTAASGIANKVAGALLDCVNEKPLTATAQMYGLVTTLDSTAYAERCHNDVALTASNTYVAPLFKTLTSRYNSTYPERVPSGGYVKDCYNEYDITAKGYVYGLIEAVNAGWTVSNCYNTGNVTATDGVATGLFNSVGQTSTSANADFEAVVDHCYNTGNVSGTKAYTSGLMYRLNYAARASYCYNLGDVTCTYNGNVSGSGIAGINYGYIDHCYNAGNIKSAGYAVGGLTGYVTKGTSSYPSRILNSFNVGDVETTYDGTTTNGNVGGLTGYIATGTAESYVTIQGCYNAGNLKARRRVGGLSGGISQSYNVVKDCYNSGQIECTGTDTDSNGNERYYQSGTIFSNNYTYVEKINEVSDTVLMLKNCTNCFYDKTLFNGSQFRSVANSAKTTSELTKLNISDDFELPANGGYPILKGFDSQVGNDAGQITILLTDEATETAGTVVNAITLIAPEGTTWSQAALSESDELVTGGENGFSIDGTVAKPIAKGDFALIATTKDNVQRIFKLTLNPSIDALDSTLAGKEIRNVIYVDLQGRIVPTPVPGNVYIVKTNYVDGTSSVVKKIAK